MIFVLASACFSPVELPGIWFHRAGGQIGDLPKLPALDQLCGERPHGGKESREEPEGFGGAVWAFGRVEMRASHVMVSVWGSWIGWIGLK